MTKKCTIEAARGLEMPIKGLKKLSRGRIVADGMLRENTPIIDRTEKYGLWVKREDLSCPAPGPPFSKTRGVYARIKTVEENLIGVLDTRHSQAGHAVSRACQLLGKKCVNYYPALKASPEPKEPQERAKELGAEIVPLKAGRSSILFHQAKKLIEAREGYMMPNALKLDESVDETAKEVRSNCEQFSVVVIPASSGTIAAGVIKGFARRNLSPLFIVHLGYSRSLEQVNKYLMEKSGEKDIRIEVVDEKYDYKDKSREKWFPSWPCNPTMIGRLYIGGLTTENNTKVQRFSGT